jgi:glycogen synthase
VGGLHDTVTDSETGFVFVDQKVKSFNDTLRRALQLYPYHSRWANLQKAGMSQDFSWPTSAQKYLEIYKKLIEASKAPPPASGETYPTRPLTSSRRIREEKNGNEEE